MTDPDIGVPLNAEAGSRELLLFVCAANVCRSPAMEFLTAHELRGRGVVQPWRFASAGTTATEGDRMCVRSAGAISNLSGGMDFIRAHRSRLLSTDLVSRAGIILVSSREERSMVARLSPDARERTFTMIEAALLAESAVELRMTPGRESRPVTLDSLGALMHSTRGVIIPKDPARVTARIASARPRSRSIDIRDVHTGSLSNHRPVLREVSWASQHLAQAFVGLLGPVR